MSLFAPLLLLLFVFVQGDKADEGTVNKCVSTCPEDWVKVENHCLVWPRKSMKWHRAEKFCNKEGGHLASVTNNLIHNYIGSEFQRQNVLMVWIGGMYKKKEKNGAGAMEALGISLGGKRRNRKTAKKDLCLKIEKTDGKWRERNCDSSQRFICSQLICTNPVNETKVTRTKSDEVNNNDINSNNSNSDNINTNSKTNHQTILAISLGLPVGLILFVLIGCLVWKRYRRKEEKMNADLNPVYGIYQLDEAYERQYSTNEAVDNNFYYED